MKATIGFAVALSLVSFTPVLPAAAPAGAQSSDKICMAKRTGKRSGGKSIATVVVSEAKAKRLQDRGFKQTSCASQKSERDDYQTQICRFAKIAPAKVQEEFTRDHGVSPAELCEAGK